MERKFTIKKTQRYVGILISLVFIILSTYLIFENWHSDLSSFKKLAIYVSFTLGILAFIKNIILVDEIKVMEDGLIFDYGFGRKRKTNWENLTKIEYGIHNSKSFFLFYLEKNILIRVLLPRLIENVDELLNIIVTNIEKRNIKIEIDDTVERVLELYNKRNETK